MGNRRIGRVRLHALEKLGKSLTAEEIGIGVGMQDALVRATQKRDGLIVETEIVLDLGTSKAAIDSGGDNAAIGVAGAAAEVFKWTLATFGRLLEIETVCVETPTTGADAIGLFRKATSVNGSAAHKGQGGVTAVHTGTTFAIGTVETDAVVTDIYTATPFFTLASEEAVDAVYDAGKLVIRVTGQADPADSDI